MPDRRAREWMRRAQREANHGSSYAEVLAEQCAGDALGLLGRAVSWFARHDVAVERVIRAHSALDHNAPISRLDRNNVLTRNS